MKQSPSNRRLITWVPRAMTLACASLAALPAWAGPAGMPAITAVTLSSGGTAEIHRRATVRDNDTLQLTVPLAQVDDLLKSLLVRDAAGQVGAMTLPGLAPVEEAFATLPFGPDDLAALPRLVSALAGVSVRASSGGRTVEGVVLGVASVPVFRDGGQTQAEQLTVQDAKGLLQVVRLGPDTELTVLDETVRAQLQRAVAVHGQQRTESARQLSLSLRGQGEREVALSYVVPAPVWKAAYRLMTEDGKPFARLQAWAVVENASGEDWQDVAVTLTSGAPVTLSQQLHARYWQQRPELPVAVGAAAPPRVDDQSMRDSAASSVGAELSSMVKHGYAMASAPAAAPVPTRMRRADVAAPTQQAKAQESAVNVRYALPGRLSVPAGQTLSVPFVDKQLAAEQVSVFQPERGSAHPVAGIQLSNDTGASLPPGILTVYDAQGGHAGDAQLPALAVGERRMVYFADDTKVSVRPERKPSEQITEVRLADGVLRARRVSRIETRYQIQGAQDAARVVVIEQPRRDGWTLTSAALQGDTANHHRLRVAVPAGGQAEVATVMERALWEEMALVQADEQTLIRWSGSVADAATAQRLRELASLRADLAGAERREQAARDGLEAAVGDQGRVRDNLAAVPPDSALGQRYLGMLAEQEDAIAGLRRSVDEAVVQVRTLRERYAAAIAA